MANCPKCGHKLKLTDLSQFCPACGVNMRFVGFEETFYREAKYAELSQANVKVKFARFKAAFIGSKLTIVRLVVSLLPALSLLVPSGFVSSLLPFYESKTDLSLMGLIGLFTGKDFGYLTGVSGDLSGAVLDALRRGLFAYLAAAAFAVIVLLATILCFLSVKNMQKIIAGLSCAGAVVSVAALILIPNANDPVFAVHKGFGLLVSVVAFAAVAAVNLLLDKKGVPVVYAEGMEERAKLYKELKAGKLDLDKLPQPIVETAETRKIDEEIAQEQEDYRKAHEKEAK